MLYSSQSFIFLASPWSRRSETGNGIYKSLHYCAAAVAFVLLMQQRKTPMPEVDSSASSMDTYMRPLFHNLSLRVDFVWQAKQHLPPQA